IDLFPAELRPLERLLRGRPRAHAHDRRIDAHSRVGADGGQRRQPELLRLAVRHDDHRGAAVVDARGVAGSDRAVLLEGGLESREPLRGGVAAWVLVGVEAERLALLGGDLDRYDLRLELPALLRGGRLLLALRRELVLLLAADAIFAGDVLGGDAHVHEGDRAGEAVGDHRVEDLVVPQADAEAGLLQDVGRAAHALHAARDDHLGVAELDGLGREHDRLQPRAAGLVHREARHLLRDAAVERGDAARVQPEARREHVAQDHLVHLRGLEAGAAHRLERPVRFQILTGTSVGAIHACYVAATLGRPHAGRGLIDIWRSLEVRGVYQVGVGDVVGIPLRLLGLAGQRTMPAEGAIPERL